MMQKRNGSINMLQTILASYFREVIAEKRMVGLILLPSFLYVFNRILCSYFVFSRILYIMCIISHIQYEDRKAN